MNVCKQGKHLIFSIKTMGFDFVSAIFLEVCKSEVLFNYSENSVDIPTGEESLLLLLVGGSERISQSASFAFKNYESPSSG